MDVVPPPLAVEVALGIAPTALILCGGTSFKHHALHTRPGLDRRAVVDQKCSLENSPDPRVIEPPPPKNTDVPAEQNALVELLHQLPLRAHRVDALAEATQQMMWMAPGPGI